MDYEKQAILNNIAELEEELAELKKREEELENNDNEEEYDDMLDSCYPDIEIMGMTYSTSKVLSEVDPIAYRCGHSDYNDSLLSDIQSEIEEKVAEIEELKKTL